MDFIAWEGLHFAFTFLKKAVHASMSVMFVNNEDNKLWQIKALVDKSI